jgi:hypothetical protein
MEESHRAAPRSSVPGRGGGIRRGRVRAELDRRTQRPGARLEERPGGAIPGHRLRLRTESAARPSRATVSDADVLRPASSKTGGHAAAISTRAEMSAAEAACRPRNRSGSPTFPPGTAPAAAPWQFETRGNLMKARFEDAQRRMVLLGAARAGSVAVGLVPDFPAEARVRAEVLKLNLQRVPGCRVVIRESPVAVE